MTRQAGFSLPELLVAMAIAGILSGIGYALFQRQWQGERTKAAARELAARLDELRRRSQQKAGACHLNLDPATASLSPAASNTTACGDFGRLDLRAAVQAGSDLVLCVQDLDSTAACSTATAGTTLVFTPRGTATTSALLRLHRPGDNSDRCVAVVAPLGLIRSGRASAAGGSCDFTTAF
jgi:prepilin-type N-terminal cleavage/methylation domain-containing protein